MFSKICHQRCNTCFQKYVILSPISTHLQPKKPPLLVAQVGLGVHWLLVFSLEASWQQFRWFRSSDITGVRRWLCALSAGWGLQLFHKAGDGGTGREPDPLTLPPSPIQELQRDTDPHLCFSGAALPYCPMQLSLLETCRIWEGRKEWGIMGFRSFLHLENGLNLNLAPGISLYMLAEWIYSVGDRMM